MGAVDRGRAFSRDLTAHPRYHEISHGVTMTGMLIRGVPDDVVAAPEAHARRLGLSRTEYVRRRLAQDAAVSDSPVTAGELARFAAPSATWPTRT